MKNYINFFILKNSFKFDLSNKDNLIRLEKFNETNKYKYVKLIHIKHDYNLVNNTSKNIEFLKQYNQFLFDFENLEKTKFKVEKKKISFDFFQKNRFIKSPPLSMALDTLKFIFPKKSFEKIYEPLIMDIRDEYFTALNEDNKSKANWIHIRGCLILLKTIPVHSIFSIYKLFSKFLTIV